MKYFHHYCNWLERVSAILSVPLVRARKLRGDESGNVMLLSGMMAFLFTIFALVSADTSQAIYNRIVAQNSVDAAADAAALWQARGCNMVQNLNNYHYEANEMFAKTEATALDACSLAFILKAVITAFPVLTPVVGPVLVASCVACDSAPLLDDGQYLTSSGIIAEQKLIIGTVPFITLAAANDAAEGSGADELFASSGDWTQKVGQPIGLDLSGLQSVFQQVGTILNQFGFTVHALPLDPMSLKLGLHSQTGTRGPWKFGPCPLEVAAGRNTCFLWNPFFGSGPEQHYGANWGWHDDLYFTGQPGYMTWVAGKKTNSELAGLGFLRWLNPNPTPPAEVTYWLSQMNLPMYKDSVSSSGNLEIPAYIAFASSQVDGVNRKTKWQGVGLNSGETPRTAGAYPYLIPVYFPNPTSPNSPKAGTSFWIYH